MAPRLPAASTDCLLAAPDALGGGGSRFTGAAGALLAFLAVALEEGTAVALAAGATGGA